MSGTMLGLVALGLVVLSLFIWMNVAMVRHRSRGSRSASAEERPGSTQSRPVNSDVPQETADGPAAAAMPASVSTPHTLEVVTDIHSLSGRRVFDRPGYPFVLKGASVPEFGQAAWVTTFRRLTEDPRILGWVAFSGETMGAADRDYDTGFLEVIRDYLAALEKLRREVGLTQIRETSIVAEEGNVWFLTAREDAWFALFVEPGTDMQEVSNRLLGPVSATD